MSYNNGYVDPWEADSIRENRIKTYQEQLGVSFQEAQRIFASEVEDRTYRVLFLGLRREK